MVHGAEYPNITGRILSRASSGVVEALPSAIPDPIRSRLALDWREEFFSELHVLCRWGLPPEDIDVTHRRSLFRILKSTGVPPDGAESTVAAGKRAVRLWHNMASWSDVLPAPTALKNELGVELFVLTNGATRLQLDLVRSSGLEGTFRYAVFSELSGVYKPGPEAYEKSLGLVRVRPDEAVMAAVHAYELKAARAGSSA
ncbi:hypothetical protein F5B19DRAFT_494194 [Rostrohypoxylon terebratum]|nr:hypothetical protein F5B19DRAFT_494194 [Rostrohypoxylon terebratum]